MNLKLDLTTEIIKKIDDYIPGLTSIMILTIGEYRSGQFNR